jgi:hypothetical protein
MTTTVELRECNTCETERPLHQFPLDRRTSSGLSWRCTPCRTRPCAHCGNPFAPHSDQQVCCSSYCGRLRLIESRGGCKTCAINGACDCHQVPPVCVHDHPEPDGIGQCRLCLRPYKPAVPGFDAVRQAWREQLEMAS